MRKYDMAAVYTVAAVPLDVSKNISDSAVPLPVKIPYTFADAVELAEKYNQNPAYKGILRNLNYSHFVPFNIEAITMKPDAYLLRAMLQSKERGEALANHYRNESTKYQRIIDDWRDNA